MIKENAIFSLEQANKGRQLELDLMKGLAIVFMLLVHCFEEFSAWPLPKSISTYIIRFLGSPPAAPAFMFALGIGIVYSRNSSPKALVTRGIKLFLLGFILNFFRDFLPELVLYHKTGELSHYTEAFNFLWGVDILPFAALAFIFFGIAAKFKFGEIHYGLAAIVFAGLNLLLKDIAIEGEALNIILGLFWGTNEYTWFPFLTWIAFPISGYLFGKLLIHCVDKRRFYRISFWASLPVLGLFWVYSYKNGVDFGALDGLFVEAYFHHDLIGNIVLIAFTVMWTSLIYFLSFYLPAFAKQALSRWSKNITTMYCVHWLIIGWSLTILPLPLSLPWILLYFVLLLVITDLISVYYLKLIARVTDYFKTARGAAQTG